MNKQEQQEYERILKQNKGLQNELIYLKTKINNKKQWLIKALDDEENQSETMQIKLYAQINILKEIIGE